MKYYQDGHAHGWGRFPMISPDAINEAPEGLYEIDVPSERHSFFDAINAQMLPEDEHVRVVRIDSGDKLPEGVIDARFRADGKRVVLCLIPADPSGHAEFNLASPPRLNGKPWPPEFFPEGEK